ncbi:M55 family metallopeptidase [Nonomuraea sp. CA-143628]|uniref:M55 family metallopeptidase n=1 Tax=Nonomuraea sp. CA-143628 TaxID=3239997 RepID=UPI003D8E9FB4
MALQPQAYVRTTWKGVIEMRVLVSVDMEGIAGVVDGDDVIPGHSEYERNRKLLTAEASAAVRGVHAYEAGAQVLVTEAHARFRNLLPELLDRRAELLRGAPKPDGMMAGLADGIDAVLFIGYHGKAGTPRSVIAHTVSGGVIADVRCNGRSLGEIGLNTALAAHSGVPPVLVSGDDTVAAEAAEVAPGIRSVVVKHALGARAAALLHPDEACDRIEQAIPEALAGRGAVRPLRFDGPVRLEVRVHRPRMTEYALLVPGMELEDGCTLRYAAPDFPTAYQVIELIATLGAV